MNDANTDTNNQEKKEHRPAYIECKYEAYELPNELIVVLMSLAV